MLNNNTIIKGSVGTGKKLLVEKLAGERDILEIMFYNLSNQEDNHDIEKENNLLMDNAIKFIKDNGVVVFDGLIPFTQRIMINCLAVDFPNSIIIIDEENQRTLSAEQDRFTIIDSIPAL